jgi:hypothetical protein
MAIDEELMKELRESWRQQEARWRAEQRRYRERKLDTLWDATKPISSLPLPSEPPVWDVAEKLWVIPEQRRPVVVLPTQAKQQREAGEAKVAGLVAGIVGDPVRLHRFVGFCAERLAAESKS